MRPQTPLLEDSIEMMRSPKNDQDVYHPSTPVLLDSLDTSGNNTPVLDTVLDRHNVHMMSTPVGLPGGEEGLEVRPDSNESFSLPSMPCYASETNDSYSTPYSPTQPISGLNLSTSPGSPLSDSIYFTPMSEVKQAGKGATQTEKRRKESISKSSNLTKSTQKSARKKSASTPSGIDKEQTSGFFSICKSLAGKFINFSKLTSPGDECLGDKKAEKSSDVPNCDVTFSGSDTNVSKDNSSDIVGKEAGANIGNREEEVVRSKGNTMMESQSSESLHTSKTQNDQHTMEDVQEGLDGDIHLKENFKQPTSKLESNNSIVCATDAGGVCANNTVLVAVDVHADIEGTVLSPVDNGVHEKLSKESNIPLAKHSHLTSENTRTLLAKPEKRRRGKPTKCTKTSQTNAVCKQVCKPKQLQEDHDIIYLEGTEMSSGKILHQAPLLNLKEDRKSAGDKVNLLSERNETNVTKKKKGRPIKHVNRTKFTVTKAYQEKECAGRRDMDFRGSAELTKDMDSGNSGCSSLMTNDLESGNFGFSSMAKDLDSGNSGCSLPIVKDLDTGNSGCSSISKDRDSGNSGCSSSIANVLDLSNSEGSSKISMDPVAVDSGCCKPTSNDPQSDGYRNSGPITDDLMADDNNCFTSNKKNPGAVLIGCSATSSSVNSPVSSLTTEKSVSKRNVNQGNIGKLHAKIKRVRQPKKSASCIVSEHEKMIETSSFEAKNSINTSCETHSPQSDLTKNSAVFVSKTDQGVNDSKCRVIKHSRRTKSDSVENKGKKESVVDGVTVRSRRIKSDTAYDYTSVDADSKVKQTFCGVSVRNRRKRAKKTEENSDDWSEILCDGAYDKNMSDEHDHEPSVDGVYGSVESGDVYKSESTSSVCVNIKDEKHSKEQQEIDDNTQTPTTKNKEEMIECQISHKDEGNGFEVEKNCASSISLQSTAPKDLHVCDMALFADLDCGTESNEIVEKPKSKRKGKRRSGDLMLASENQELLQGMEEESGDAENVIESSRKSRRIKRKSLELNRAATGKGLIDAEERENDGTEKIVDCSEQDEDSRNVLGDIPFTTNVGPCLKTYGKRKKRESEQDVINIYLNKNYKPPAEQKWETIFESPDGKNLNLTGKRKLKRAYEFDIQQVYHVPVAKQKKRQQRAMKQGWNTRKRKLQALSDQTVLDKLAEVDRILAD